MSDEKWTKTAAFRMIMYGVCVCMTCMSWIRILNIPKILQNGDTYLHLAAKTGQSKMFEMIFANETVKNPCGIEG